jgi:cytochrome c
MRIFLLLSLYCFSITSFAQDVTAGKALYQECVACHSTEPGASMMGPSLAGVYGRKAGTSEGFRFSNAMKKSGFVWDSTSLDTYLADPQAAIPGSRMPYSGMSGVEDRKNLIAYLKTL